MEIPAHIQSAINRYDPVTVEGLTLYPIQVKNREAFWTAAPAISFMQQSFPVALMRLPLLEAYYKMVMDAIKSGNETENYFYRAILFLALALRLGEGQSDNDRVSRFRLVVDSNDPEKLKAVEFTVDGEESIQLTPAQFQRLRPILAAQNGIELESDDANPELIEAEREQAQYNAPKLRIDFNDQLSFVAALSSTSEGEIEEWPILRLRRREKTYTHLLRYLLCGVAEAARGQFKGGNPCPHPYYEREQTAPAGLKKLSDVVSDSAAQNAVNRPGEQISQQLP